MIFKKQKVVEQYTEYHCSDNKVYGNLLFQMIKKGRHRHSGQYAFEPAEVTQQKLFPTGKTNLIIKNVLPVCFRRVGHFNR